MIIIILKQQWRLQAMINDINNYKQRLKQLYLAHIRTTIILVV